MKHYEYTDAFKMHLREILPKSYSAHIDEDGSIIYGGKIMRPDCPAPTLTAWIKHVIAKIKNMVEVTF